MDYYKRALQLQDETVAHRRWFHQNAEVGLSMPKGQAYVLETLEKLGIEAKPCGQGVSATVGRGERCILLRADMDALPMKEESGLDFACPTGAEAHCCGHDFHVAMLLTAAKMLKEREADLGGTVKFMFQSGEENLEGAQDMLEQGILETPRPQAALAFHVAAGQMPPGVYMYNAGGPMMFSVDSFRITIRGKGAHGAYPQAAIDPIGIGCQIYQALEGLTARETDPMKANIITMGRFSAGNTGNVIPETATLEGSVRSNDETSGQRLVARLEQIATGTARLYGGDAQVDLLRRIPSLICDPGLTEQMAGFIGELGIPGATPHPGICASASEDFALVARQVPSVYMYLSAGFADGRGAAPAHNPKVLFNEAVCPIGAACYAQCATRWLENH